MTNEKAPERIWAQLTAAGNVIAHNRDPREVHDNGQPVYTYRLDRSSSVQRKMIVHVVEGRPRSKRADWNAYGWRPVDHAVQSPTAKKRLRLHRQARPEWEFRLTPYIPMESN